VRIEGRNASLAPHLAAGFSIVVNASRPYFAIVDAGSEQHFGTHELRDGV
jgi:hypothetical protein